MKYLKTKWKRFFPGVLFLFLALELPVHALEINRVRDLYFYGEEKEASLVLLMKSRPAYSVREKSTGETVVFLENTESSSRVLERIHKNSWPLGISRHEKKNLKCVLKAPGKVREVRTTWLADRKLLYLQFFLKKHSASGGDTPIASGSGSITPGRFWRLAGKHNGPCLFGLKRASPWNCVGARHIRNEEISAPFPGFGDCKSTKWFMDWL